MKLFCRFSIPIRYLSLLSSVFLLGCSEGSEGIVTLIDKPAQRISIARDGVTVVFHVREPDMLNGVDARDRVKFVYERISGKFTILSIDKAR